MMHNLKTAFDERYGGIKITKALCDEIYLKQIKFVTKNSEYIEFFGGNLIGVHVVKFTASDEQNIFDIFDTNEKEIDECSKKAEGINQSFIVASDPYNLFSVYVAHRILESELPEKTKHIGAMNILLLMYYRFLTGIVNHFFRYPIDKDTAEVIYNNLSYKYILKQKGSWSAALEYRSEELVSKNSIHYDEILKFDNDEKIMYIISDSYNRIKDMIKNLYREFLKVKESGIKYHKTSQIQIDDEGADSFKDLTKGLEIYKTYMYKIVGNTNDLIKKELVSIVVDLVPAILPDQVIKTLNFMVKHNHDQNKHYIDEYLDLLLVYSYNEMKTDYDIINTLKDLPEFLTTLKGKYQSSKSKEPDLLKLRELGDMLIEDSTDIRTKITLSSLRTANFLYMVLRVFTKNYYK